MTDGWPCALSPVTRESNTVCAPQTAAHMPLSKHVLFLVSSSSLEWLRCCHRWQMVITSVKCFWTHGWVPWTTPRQASGSGSRVITRQSNIGDHQAPFNLLLIVGFRGTKPCLLPASLLTWFHQVDTLCICLTSSQFLPCFCIFTWKLGVFL